jgi:hypothetical protein
MFLGLWNEVISEHIWNLGVVRTVKSRKLLGAWMGESLLENGHSEDRMDHIQNVLTELVYENMK